MWIKIIDIDLSEGRTIEDGRLPLPPFSWQVSKPELSQRVCAGTLVLPTVHMNIKIDFSRNLVDRHCIWSLGVLGGKLEGWVRNFFKCHTSL